MKASELIKILQKQIKENGDLEVEVPKTDDCYYGHTEIQSIEIDNDYFTNKKVIEITGW